MQASFRHARRRGPAQPPLLSAPVADELKATLGIALDDLTCLLVLAHAALALDPSKRRPASVSSSVMAARPPRASPTLPIHS
ncbi:MAG: hypothetical protein ACLU0O_08680 [Collinsella sp.]